MACWISLSRQVGTPSKRSPPPGLGITTRRTGEGRYVPASRASRTDAQCSRSHGTSSSVVMPSTPGAPPLALTRLNARPRFSGESICSHKRDLQAGDDSILGARRPAATLSCGAQRNSPSPPGSWPASAGWLRSPRPARATPIPPSHLTFGPSRPPYLIPAGTTTSADFCPVSPHLAIRAVGAATPTAQPTPGQISPDKNDQFPPTPAAST